MQTVKYLILGLTLLFGMGGTKNAEAKLHAGDNPQIYNKIDNLFAVRRPRIY